MDKYEKVKIISENLQNISCLHKNLYYRIDYNGFTGERRKSYGSNMPFASWLLSSLILAKSWKGEYFPDPGIGIFDNKTHKLLDTIYWYENPEKILEYFPISKL
jgi:hypothetical protein